jgi:hypothetical protein
MHLALRRRHVAGSNVAVIGGRRIGKTSILKQLEHSRLPAAGLYAYYHDCSYAPTETELVTALAADRSWFPIPPSYSSNTLMETVQRLPDDKSTVILLDEFDKLIPGDREAGHPICSALRSLSNSGRAHFVLCGEQALHTEVLNPSSRLYNFASLLRVGRLNYETVVELVSQPMNRLEIVLENESEIVRVIWNLTAGHPSVVQSLCQRLINRLKERGSRQLTIDDVNAIISDPDFVRRDFLSIYWERATVLERLCSLVMVAFPEIRTLEALFIKLKNYEISVSLNEIDSALERLVDLRNILRRTDAGYEFDVTSFPQILSVSSRIKELIALDCEKYRLYGDVE